MIDKMYKIRDMLCDELDKIADKGELSAGTLTIVDTLFHAIKNADKVICTENEMDDEYSEASYGDMSGRRMSRNGGMSGRRGGRMSRDGGSYRGGSYASYDDGKSHMIDKLNGLMAEAKGEEKEIIRDMIAKMERI